MTKREIKFRAWNSNGHDQMDSWRVLTDVYRASLEVLDGIRGVVFEQYTGLEDINGVEIYEGDILRTHVVILSPDDQVGVVIYNPNYGYTIKYTSGRVARQEYWANDDKANYEVIGNVHEKPELLGE